MLNKISDFYKVLSEKPLKPNETDAEQGNLLSER